MGRVAQQQPAADVAGRVRAQVFHVVTQYGGRVGGVHDVRLRLVPAGEAAQHLEVLAVSCVFTLQGVGGGKLVGAAVSQRHDPEALPTPPKHEVVHGLDRWPLVTMCRAF